MNSDQFWLNDINELFKNYNEIIPTKKMSRNNQLNALSRLCIYILVIMILFNVNIFLLLIPITFLSIIILFNNLGIFDCNDISSIKENKEPFNSLIVSDNSQDFIYSDMSNLTQQNDIMTNDIVTNLTYTPSNQNMSTLENNNIIYPSIDYNNINLPVACNVNDSEINENIKVNFNPNLFNNVSDVWERENSTRQFYTMPNTSIPNNQTEFALWLYSLPPSANCKEEQEGCLRYDDLRSNIR